MAVSPTLLLAFKLHLVAASPPNYYAISTTCVSAVCCTAISGGVSKTYKFWFAGSSSPARTTSPSLIAWSLAPLPYGFRAGLPAAQSEERRKDDDTDRDRKQDRAGGVEFRVHAAARHFIDDHRERHIEPAQLERDNKFVPRQRRLDSEGEKERGPHHGHGHEREHFGIAGAEVMGRRTRYLSTVIRWFPTSAKNHGRGKKPLT